MTTIHSDTNIFYKPKKGTFASIGCMFQIQTIHQSNKTHYMNVQSKLYVSNISSRYPVWKVSSERTIWSIKSKC